MLLKKTGFPEEEELVLCTVTGVNPNSVFCGLDEYSNRTGMIHISEVAPGRIRNIREFVQEGKKVVCKVLRVNKEKGYIDLSLRRVNETQKRNKLDEIKKELLAEKIVEQVAKQTGENPLALFNKLAEKLLEKYYNIYAAFEAVANDKLDLSTIIEKKLADQLTEAVKQRIKPPEVRITGELKLSTYSPEGINLLKAALELPTKAGVKVRYKGGGAYHFEIIAKDYKEAERVLKKAVDEVMAFAKEKGMIASFERKEE